MGSSLVNSIQTSGQTAQDAYKKEKEGFEQKAIGVTEEQKNTTSGIINKAAGGKLKEDESTQASEVGDAVNQINANTAGYKGPTGLTGEGQGAASKAASVSRQGVGQLLQGQYGRNSAYNPSLRRFDTMLVNRSPELQKIREAQAGISGAGEQYNRLAGYATDRAQQLTSEHEAFKQNVFKDIADKLGKTNTDIDTQLNTAKSESDALATRIKEKIKNGSFYEGDPDLDALINSGLDIRSASGAMTRDELANFLESKAGNLTRTNVMSEDQANALRALSAIGGKSYGDTDVGIEDATKIGQGSSGIGFNTGLNTYSGQVGNEIKSIESEYTPKLEQASNIANATIAEGEGLGVKYTPGEDYNMKLHNTKTYLQREINRLNPSGNMKGGYNTPLTPEQQAQKDELIRKVAKIEELQNKYVSSVGNYTTLYNEAKNKATPYLTGSGKATRYQSISSLLGLDGKGGIPTSGNFLRGFDPSSPYKQSPLATTNKKIPRGK
jgi:hypothetical protein